jgi:hypothetical protein
MAPNKYRDRDDSVSETSREDICRMTYAPPSPIAAPKFRLEADGKDR